MRAPMDRAKAKPTTLAIIEELEFFAEYTSYSLDDVSKRLSRKPEALLAVAQKYSCIEAYTVLSGRNMKTGKVLTGAIRL